MVDEGEGKELYKRVVGGLEQLGLFIILSSLAIYSVMKKHKYRASQGLCFPRPYIYGSAHSLLTPPPINVLQSVEPRRTEERGKEVCKGARSHTAVDRSANVPKAREQTPSASVCKKYREQRTRIH